MPDSLQVSCTLNIHPPGSLIGAPVAALNAKI